MNFKLGLDLGVASVGWGIIDENYNIIDSGVRLFSEASAKENVKRREMRSSRRRVRRVRHRLDRMGILLSEILEIDLPEPFGNIYEIRCRGLKEKLKKEELFLALMHLTKRRGTFYLTADDIENKEDNGKSTEEILLEQEIKLKENYICEIQYKEFLEKGRVRGTENRFKNKEYLHELEALLNMQAQFYPVIAEYKDEIYKIYNSKREYFEGPGSEKSPTPYGSYRYDENGNVIKVNLIDLMRGKCTYFPDEKRIAKGAYTAALFNILNDLNNLKIKDRKITEEEKRNLIENYINKGKNITLNYIAKVTGVDVEEISGYRIDKSEKPIFTEFKQYKDILKVFDKFGDRKLVEGNALLCDDIAEVLTKEKSVDIRKSELEKRGIEKNIASEIAKLSGFTQYHSLSKKAINTIIGDLWSTGKNQMQLFHDCGLTEYKNRANLGEKIKFDGSEWIVSPITKRTVTEAVKVINACRKMLKQKYNTEFSDVVIEMAREKNLDEKKKMEKDIQKKNELRAKAIHELTSNRKLTPRQFEIINLLLDQDMRSAYSGKAVSLPQVYEGMLEVDHIIIMLSALLGKEAIFEAGETVLILDEIQDCPEARTALKFFHLDGRFDVIGTGSLLGVKGYGKEPKSIPVGSEAIIDMYPLDFEEFLWANGIAEPVSELPKKNLDAETPVPEALHQRMRQLLLQYAVVGGMPEAVQTFVDTRQMNDVLRIQRDIIRSYEDDMVKYAEKKDKSRIKECFQSIPKQLSKENKKFQYSVVKKGSTASKYEGSLSDFLSVC